MQPGNSGKRDKRKSTVRVRSRDSKNLSSRNREISDERQPLMSTGTLNTSYSDVEEGSGLISDVIAHGDEEEMAPETAEEEEEQEFSIVPLSRWERFVKWIKMEEYFTPRVIRMNEENNPKKNPLVKGGPFPENIVKNTKYNILTFLPITLYNQFKYFINIYFLAVALSQFIPILKVGFLFTYVAPLAFVVGLSLAKEAYDDIKRMIQDKSTNGEIFTRLLEDGTTINVKSSDICVGDFLVLNKDQRIPADCVLLHTTDKSDTSFVRTDQLDGETDWKLKKPLPTTQKMKPAEIALVKASIYAEAPQKEIYAFKGKVKYDGLSVDDSVNIDNMFWGNCVVASGTNIVCVVYSGSETRAALNRTSPRTKRGKTEDEINNMTIILFIILFLLSFMMVAFHRFSGSWVVNMFRFFILFSAIIPISMRVNLDMAKLLYAYFISDATYMPGSAVRNSNIPEELGRVQYLLTDKTGTLTQNDMTFKKLHIGSKCLNSEDIETIREIVVDDGHGGSSEDGGSSTSSSGPSKGRVMKQDRGYYAKTVQCIRAMALCHNVTPSVDVDTGVRQYQASSPDEVALVKFTEEAGIILDTRDTKSVTLKTPHGPETYSILNVFPFSSATKRMGIIVKNSEGKIQFFMKGADVVMLKIISPVGSDWMADETGNMAREGLRTLVFGMKDLSDQEYNDFAEKFHKAECSMKDREERVQGVIETLERDLHPLCVTGVEDKLQEKVRPTLESLQHAGIKVWMLTGDKVETATCIAISTALFKPTNTIFTIAGFKDNIDACKRELDKFTSMPNAVLVVDGNSLQIFLDHFRPDFFSAAARSTSVVCCRCSPTQKAEIVKMLQEYTKCTTCAIGDGGNDVSMIQAADVGVGIVGKEGKQASLASDFSITQFCHLQWLLLWHGRNSYKRSASLAQFIIHRGFIITIIQVVFSAIFFFAPVAIYQGWLLVGYATFYTMAPVFSLAFDRDVSDSVAIQFPELYKDLQTGRVLSNKTFMKWLFMSTYQGCAIMLCTIFFFDSSMQNIVSITFTTLILTELINIACQIVTWRWIIFLGEVLTLALYIFSMRILSTYFNWVLICSLNFWVRVLASVLVACLPISFVSLLIRLIRPPTELKVGQAKDGSTCCKCSSSLSGF